MASPFVPLVVSYSVTDFEKRTPSTIPQNKHFSKDAVDNKYYPLRHRDEKNYQSRHKSEQHKHKYEIQQTNKSTLIVDYKAKWLTRT
jgi:hypothetical protein